MDLLRRLRRAVDRLIDLTVILAAAGLLVALGAVTADVVGRAFGRPLYGARDIVAMAGIFIVFGGMAHAHRRTGHISVDLFERSFPPGVNRLLLILANLLGAAVFALIARELARTVPLARMLNMSTNLLMIPRWPFLWVMTAFAAVTVASMLLRAAELAFGAGRRAP